MASRVIDNVIAYKILRMLVTNFNNTEAFKLGIIDASGKTIRKTNQFTTDAERNAYNYLTRLVFNMKKLINKLGGENQLKSMAAAIWLIKETYKTGNIRLYELEVKYTKIMELNIHLVEEEILVNRFLKEDAPANNTSGSVSTQEPKIEPKNKKKYIMSMIRRPAIIVKEIV